MRSALFVIMMSFLAMNSWGQMKQVSGTVTDAATGSPITGVSITTEGLSVVTNEDGFFTLKSEKTPTDIFVTHVGYHSLRLPLGGHPTENMKIRLTPTVIQLDEVVVTSDNPRDLVMAAIAKIGRNYSQKPELYHCFYRETAMKRQHYISVAEGVIDMYKTGYRRGTLRDRVAINKGRRLLSTKQSDTLGVKVLGGPVAPVELDLPKNTDILLTAEELQLYDLKMEQPTVIGDRHQYVVGIKPRADVPYALYNGRLYIDQETLAFTRAELSLDMSDRDKATRAMLVRKPAGVRFRPKEMSLVVDYRPGADGVMRMSYIRTTFRFNCDWKRRLLATSFAAFCEMAVTSTNTSDIQPISGRESFDQRDAFFDKVDYFRDPTFWQDYNIIEPSVTLDKAVNRLLKRAAR